jgi:hypothetical protein
MPGRPPPPPPPSTSRRWLIGGAAVAGVVALVYAVFFWPSEEDAIRKVVLRLADAVEVKDAAQNPAIRMLHLRSELAEVLSEEIRADIPELSEPLQGRREITALAAAAGNRWATARVSLDSMRIEIDKPSKHATVRATATLTASEHGGQLRRDTRATTFELDQVDGRWWVTSIGVARSTKDEGLPQ